MPGSPSGGGGADGAGKNALCGLLLDMYAVLVALPCPFDPLALALSTTPPLLVGIAAGGAVGAR